MTWWFKINLIPVGTYFTDLKERFNMTLKEISSLFQNFFCSRCFIIAKTILQILQHCNITLLYLKNLTKIISHRRYLKQYYYKEWPQLISALINFSYIFILSSKYILAFVLWHFSSLNTKNKGNATNRGKKLEMHV